LVFSPDGTLLAYLNPEAATPENYYHIPYLVLEETEVGAASRRVLYLPDEVGFEVYPEVEAFAFSPQSDQLILLYDAYSEYYEKSLQQAVHFFWHHNVIPLDIIAVWFLCIQYTLLQLKFLLR